MFDHHHQKQAQEHYQTALAAWQSQRDATASCLELAHEPPALTSSDILLKPGESLFGQVTSSSLVEERRGAGHYQGSSQGFSIPVAAVGGHEVRYRVGANRGHYVQAAPVSTAIDTGTLFITNQRAIFQGGHQTRECLYSKLVGFTHGADGSTTFSVSNRQKPTTVHYGTQVAGFVDFRLDLALAHYRNTVPALIAQLERDLAGLDANTPVPPTSPA